MQQYFLRKISSRGKCPFYIGPWPKVFDKIENIKTIQLKDFVLVTRGPGLNIFLQLRVVCNAPDAVSKCRQAWTRKIHFRIACPFELLYYCNADA